jgi:hypothetical protein
MGLVAQTISLSADSRSTAGVLLLTIVFIEFGGWYMLRIVRGQQPMTDFQKSFSRAGHAHAGVLVTLALVSLILADAAALSGPFDILARNGIWAAAVLMPAGFFFSSMGRDVTEPNGFIFLLYAGVMSLTVGVASLGLGLLTL